MLCPLFQKQFKDFGCFKFNDISQPALNSRPEQEPEKYS